MKNQAQVAVKAKMAWYSSLWHHWGLTCTERGFYWMFFSLAKRASVLAFLSLFACGANDLFLALIESYEEFKAVSPWLISTELPRKLEIESNRVLRRTWLGCISVTVLSMFMLLSRVNESSKFYFRFWPTIEVLTGTVLYNHSSPFSSPLRLTFYSLNGNSFPTDFLVTFSFLRFSIIWRSLLTGLTGCVFNGYGESVDSADFSIDFIRKALMLLIYLSPHATCIFYFLSTVPPTSDAP